MALNIPVLPLVGPIVGTGVDGLLNFDGVSDVVLHDGTILSPVAGVYTLTRNLYAQTIVVWPAVEVRLRGYTIATWELYGHATAVLSGDGNAAVGTTGAANLSPTTNFGFICVAGPNGRATAGNGAAGSASNAPTGGVGGAGGAAGLNIGGAAGGGTWGASVGPFVQPAMLATGYLGGPGGAPNGGRCGGAGASNGGTSGGGGGGGSGVLIKTRILGFPGTIRARGGNGGDASVADAGGGGGGGGGSIYLAYYDAVTALPATDVSGGSGGLGFAGGSNGISGGPGQVFLLNYG